MRGEADEIGRRDIGLLVRLMRMRADGAEHVIVRLGDLEQLRQPAHARRDRHHHADAGRLRTRQYARAVVGELREIQVAVVVDKHSPSLKRAAKRSKASAVRAAGRALRSAAGPGRYACLRPNILPNAHAAPKKPMASSFQNFNSITPKTANRPSFFAATPAISAARPYSATRSVEGLKSS